MTKTRTQLYRSLKAVGRFLLTLIFIFIGGIAIGVLLLCGIKST